MVLLGWEGKGGGRGRSQLGCVWSQREKGGREHGARMAAAAGQAEREAGSAGRVIGRGKGHTLPRASRSIAALKTEQIYQVVSSEPNGKEKGRCDERSPRGVLAQGIATRQGRNASPYTSVVRGKCSLSCYDMIWPSCAGRPFRGRHHVVWFGVSFLLEQPDAQRRDVCARVATDCPPSRRVVLVSPKAGIVAVVLCFCFFRFRLLV